MASFNDIIKVDIDVASSKATTGLNDVKAKMAEAEGGFSKLKAGAGGVFDGLKAAGPLAIAGIGVAIGGLVVKGISDFTSLALSAENFSTVAGTSVEDASRWIEVASDLGVETDAVQGAMMRLNREADQGKLAKFGITAEDANGRLIQTLQYLGSIPDEAARSQASFELFGKSGASMAPLIANVGELKSRLDEVSGAKIISEDDVAEAKEFRDSMDRITDAIDKLIVSAGKIALPFVEALADIGGPIAEIIGKLSELRAEAQKKADSGGGAWYDPIVGFLTQTGPEAADFFLNKIDEVTGGTGDRFGKTGDAALKLGAIVEGQGEKFVVLADETKLVTGMTDAQIAALVEHARVQIASGDATSYSTEQKLAEAEATKAATAASEARTKAVGIEMNAVLAANDADFAMADNKDKLAGLIATATEQLVLNTDANATNDVSQQAVDKTARELSRAYEEQAGILANQMVASYEAATGATATSIDKQRLFAESLVTTAGTMAPGSPIRQHLLELASAINDKLPANKKITIDVDQAAADRALQAIIDQLAGIKNKTVYVDVVGRNHIAGTGDGTGEAAMGGPVAGLTLVGEKGPELVAFPSSGAFVYTAAETASMMRTPSGAGGVGVGGGTTYVYNTVNMAPGTDAAEVVNLLQRWSKQNGPLPRVVTGV